jgi:hypothetical protein
LATWRNDEFKIGINMAGAVSAGAYTAGVLDFLVEALEEWPRAKEAYKAYLANPASPPASPVPFMICASKFSLGSAGGMCAAIASVMLQHPFTHIRNGNQTGTSNTFYESWVNQIDIRKLLATEDVTEGPNVSTQ